MGLKGLAEQMPDQAADKKQGDNNQASFHNDSSFLKNRLNTNHDAITLPRQPKLARMNACHPKWARLLTIRSFEPTEIPRMNSMIKIV